MARSPGSPDAFELLARTMVATMDARGQDDAEEAFMNTMRDYFHNLSANKKRRHADAIALAFCDEHDQFDELWDYLKETGVTGRTYSTR
jgi:Holliday junction resolvasome RuvABC endonuclease subunit